MKSTRPILLLVGFALISALSLRAETWFTDFDTAKATAQKEHKKLLLDFTGSDWCRYCIKLDEEVLGTAEFAAFAKDCVLVRLDFPRKKELPVAEKTQNAALKQQYKIQGFPTLIVADAAGTEWNRAVGYEPGSGPVAYLKELGR
ncbi:MAG TPA: thioredoxin family protein [Phycisphaerae bacterium]|nr:thioredoxin family protein [Phycisphaerae bacterium]